MACEVGKHKNFTLHKINDQSATKNYFYSFNCRGIFLTLYVLMERIWSAKPSIECKTKGSHHHPFVIGSGYKTFNRFDENAI